MTEILARLLDFVTTLAEFFQFGTKVYVYEKAVVYRMGRPHRDLETPGFHWTIPFWIETVQTANAVMATADLPSQSFTTKDGKPITVSTVVAWRIRHIRRFLCEVEDAESVLHDASRGAIRNTLAALTWQQIAEGGVALDETITAEVRRRAFRWGVEVESVCLSDLCSARPYRVFLASDE